MNSVNSLPIEIQQMILDKLSCQELQVMKINNLVDGIDYIYDKKCKPSSLLMKNGHVMNVDAMGPFELFDIMSKLKNFFVGKMSFVQDLLDMFMVDSLIEWRGRLIVRLLCTPEGDQLSQGRINMVTSPLLDKLSDFTNGTRGIMTYMAFPHHRDYWNRAMLPNGAVRNWDQYQHVKIMSFSSKSTMTRMKIIFHYMNWSQNISRLQMHTSFVVMPHEPLMRLKDRYSEWQVSIDRQLEKQSDVMKAEGVEENLSYYIVEAINPTAEHWTAVVRHKTASRTLTISEEIFPYISHADDSHVKRRRLAD